MLKNIAGLVRIKDRKEVLECLKEAFYQYPKFENVFLDKEKYMLALELTLKTEIDFAMTYGEIYSLSQDCDSIVTLIPSWRRKTGKLKSAWARRDFQKERILKAQLGEEEVKRIQVIEEIKEMEKDIGLPKKYLYISFLGVKPDFQKKGIGRNIIEKISLGNEEKSLPIVLFTNEPKNVAFYQNLGFKIIGITSSKQFQLINIYLIRD